MSAGARSGPIGSGAAERAHGVVEGPVLGGVQPAAEGAVGVNRLKPMRAGQASPQHGEFSLRRGGACPARPSIDG